MGYCDRDIIELQARAHPIERTQRWQSPEQYCLYLMHLRAYHEARALAKDLTVLDVGCNNGWGSRITAESARKVVGVDVSLNALSEAANAGCQRLSFCLVDGQTLPFKDCSFDLVTAFQIIEHIPETVTFTKELKRVLRRDGTALITTPNATIRLDPAMKPWNPFHVREYSHEELNNVLAATFSQVTIKGLFAAQELYEIEYQRVSAARLRARQSGRPMMPAPSDLRKIAIDLVKSAFPPSVVNVLRKSANKFHLPHPVVSQEPRRLEIEARLSLNDVYYSCDNLDAALDYLAICRP
jgi:SAM-dependent methyltransferase